MKSTFVCILILLIPSFLFAEPGGAVRVELTDKMVSSLLQYALSSIDGTLKVKTTFSRLSANAPKQNGFSPQGEVRYEVSLETFDLYFDSVDGSMSAEDSQKLEDALNNLRTGLERAGVQSVSFTLPSLLEVRGQDRDVKIRMKLFPRMLRLSVENGGSELNTLLSFLKDVLVSRIQEPLLEGVGSKYLNNLKLGDLFVLNAPNLAKDHIIEIQVKMGQVNGLNPLRFRSFATGKGKMILEGITVPGDDS